MLFFENRVPPKARYAYVCDSWSGILIAVMHGFTLPFIGIIAREQLHASRLQIGVLTAASVLGNLLAIFWANMMEGRRKMPFATWAWVVSRTLFLLVIFARNSNTFVGIISLYYLIGSVAGPAYSALMKEMYPDADRGRIMAYARVCTTLSAILVTLGAGKLLEVVSYRYVFPASVIFGLASAYAFNKIPANETSGDPTVPFGQFFRNSLLILHEDRGYLWFCAGIFVLGAANLMAGPVITAYQVDVLHVSTGWMALLIVIMQIVQMGGYIYWGGHVDRRPADEAAAIGAGIAGVIMFAYCFITQAWMLIPMFVASGAANAAVELAYLNGVLRYAPRDRITHYQAMFAFLMGIRGMAAPFVGSFLVDRDLASPKSIFAVAAMMTFASAVVQMVGMRRHKPIESAGK